MTGSLNGARIGVIGSRGYPSTYGGFETLVRRLAPALATAGAEVAVYGRSHERHRRERHPNGVWSIHTHGIDSTSLSTISHGLTASMHAAMRRTDAALVLNVANGFYLPLLKAAGVPTAVNVDGLEWLRAKWGRGARRTFRAGAAATARFADAIVADAEAIGTYWREQYGRDFHFIPYGADVLPPLGHDRLAEVGVEPGSYLLAVARLVPENNVDLLIDAAAKLQWRIPVVVVGSGSGSSPLEHRLRELSQGNAQLHWLGHVSDQQLLEQLWQNCALYVHGHSVGGTNPALLQALGAGAPTIALETSYNREVLGADGLTYKPSAMSLATVINDIYQDDERRSRMTEAGRTIVDSRYRWQDVLAAYGGMLASLLRR